MEEKGDAPVPLDKPHERSRLLDIDVQFCLVRSATNDTLDEVFIRVFCSAGVVAIRTQTCRRLEAHISSLFTYMTVVRCATEEASEKVRRYIQASLDKEP